MTRYWEDFIPGEVLALGSTVVDEQEMLAFGRRFDPQPFHIDPQAALDTPFGGIIASGWFTGAIFMRLWVDAVLGDSTSQGAPGLSDLRWLSPVRAGDRLRGEVHVLDSYPSARNPNRGTAVLRGELHRPDADGSDQVVMRCEFRTLFARRHPGEMP
jgi:acyl dehydratase